MVVDTMVFAYALLGAEGYRDAAMEVLDSSEAVVVPDSIRAELGNVVWQWVRQRGVDIDTGFAAMEDAEALYTRVISAELLWEEALALAVDAAHPFYDTLFVAAAEKENSRVVTFDARLKSAFPERVLTVDEFISRTGGLR